MFNMLTKKVMYVVLRIDKDNNKNDSKMITMVGIIITKLK